MTLSVNMTYCTAVRKNKPEMYVPFDVSFRESSLVIEEIRKRIQTNESVVELICREAVILKK